MLAGVLASHSRVVVTITDAPTTDFVMIMRRIRLTLAAGFMCLLLCTLSCMQYTGTHMLSPLFVLTPKAAALQSILEISLIPSYSQTEVSLEILT